MRIEVLTKNTGWYGVHSGYYERIPEYVARLHRDTRIIRPDNSWKARAAGKLIAAIRRLPVRNQSITWAEELFSRRIQNSGSVGHIMCFEDNSPLLRRWAKAPRNLFGTIHYSPDLLDAELRDALCRLSSAIVLYQRDLEFFERLVGKGRVSFIRHGVDLAFFRPSTSPGSGPVQRLAYVGQFGRDTAMFARIVPTILERHPEVEFDIVVARKNFADENMAKLQGLERVHFHTGISDERLLQIYQEATAMVLPMKASGANNAIVEAVSCGLPIITTDIGGVRDYGAGTIFPVIGAGDDDGIIELITEHLKYPGRFAAVRRELREFAGKYLDWSAAALQHIAAYRQQAEID